MALIYSKMVEVCIFTRKKGIPTYLLLHRSKEEKVYPNLWQYVTGSIEGSEKAFETARREVLEETGLKPIALRAVPHISSFYDPGWDTVNLLPLFAAEVEKKEDPVLSSEHYEFGWFSYKKAQHMLVWPSHREGLRVVHEYIARGESAGFIQNL